MRTFNIISFGILLAWGLINILLKLLGVLDRSWWVVTSPITVPLAMITLSTIGYGIFLYFASRKSKR